MTRTEFYRGRCSGRRVLDIGCVDHDFDLRNPDWWLHDILRGSASEILGIDIDHVGVEKMNAAGYNAIVADVTTDVALVESVGTFDLVVAGEVIEHVPAPQAFLAGAARFVRPGGELIITTPNPYAPWRVRAGQRGHTWENVDHVIYGFPSGMAELADRCGLQLVEFGTLNITGRSPRLRSSLMELVRTARHRHELRQRNPTDNNRLGLPLDPTWISPLDVLTMRLRRGHMLGEDAVYVLQKSE
jgi:SAM-dependent methyltransferase